MQALAFRRVTVVRCDPDHRFDQTTRFVANRHETEAALLLTRPGWKRRRVVRGTAVASVAACLTLLAACGGSGSGSASAQTGATSVSKATGHLGQMQTAQTAQVGIVNQPPFSGQSPTGGTVGFSPELAQQILKDLGVPKLTTIVGQYGDMIPGLQAGRWDFVGASLVITPQRCSQVIFSDPIVSDMVKLAYTGSSAASSLKDLIANPNIKVGILTGSTYIKTFEAAGLPDSRLVQFNDIRSGLDGVLAGRADVLAGSASGFNIQGIDSKIKFTKGLTDVPPSISAFAFKQSDTDLRDSFNADLKKLQKNDTYAKILKKWGFTGTEINGLTTQQACQSS
jgi:polar amino acid transport system substrate-binding protein